MQPNWIEFDGLVNLRDVGGTPTVDGGTITPGRLLRSDNLQDLSAADLERLAAFDVTDVVDLRSDYEVAQEGPGPLAATEVAVHQHSMFREWRAGVGEDKPDVRPEVLPEEALPWVDLEPSVQLENAVASIYFSYLTDRPDSVVAALRVIADASGAVLVHCAAGKDRTGMIVALALSLVGAERDAVVADYAASSERMEAILARLLSTRTYADNLSGRPMSLHLTHPETMVAFLEHVDAAYGGVEPLLESLGWTAEDTERLRAKLRE